MHMLSNTNFLLSLYIFIYKIMYRSITGNDRTNRSARSLKYLHATQNAFVSFKK